MNWRLLTEDNDDFEAQEEAAESELERAEVQFEHLSPVDIGEEGIDTHQDCEGQGHH